ncbi:MAG: GNAT family N-acetyltransferase, partial [Anaerolineae bacterium]|nr:GNAT family N-acetyltransferase [Anaerolineae bacterium]
MSANHPTWETPRLILPAFGLSDAKPLHSILNQEKILQYFPGSSSPSLERVGALIQRQLIHWESPGSGWWAVQPREQTELIGWRGLQYLSETDEAEIG